MKRGGIDELDRAILRHLHDDARTPVSQIAKKLTPPLSNTACRARVKKLEQLGYIKKYTILIGGKNTQFRGFQYVKIKLTTNNEASTKEISTLLCNEKNLITLELLEGAFDLLAKFGLSNLGDFDLILRELRAHKLVYNTESIYSPQIIKDYEVDIDQLI